MDADALHRDAIVLDGHTDVPTRLWETPGDLEAGQPAFHVDVPRLKEGGVDAVVFALYVPAWLSPEDGFVHAIHLHEIASAQLGNRLVATRSAAEVRAARERGAVAVLWGLENGRPLILPGALDCFEELGARYVTLTHLDSHELCDASTGEALHGGLSDRGVALVRELNRRGILVDVSHVSDDAVAHCLEVTRVPLVASHSSARALCDHPRNLPDELVRRIAAAGGVVMANAYPVFLDPAAAVADAARLERLLPIFESLAEAYAERPELMAETRRRLFRAHPLPAVTLDALVDHVLHLVEVAGEEHVGIGTDFDGIPETPDGFDSAADFPALTARLLERGLSPDAVRGILGENFLRVLETAEAAAG